MSWKKDIAKINDYYWELSTRVVILEKELRKEYDRLVMCENCRQQTNLTIPTGSLVPERFLCNHCKCEVKRI